jgi:hypothetical protein
MKLCKNCMIARREFPPASYQRPTIQEKPQPPMLAEA